MAHASTATSFVHLPCIQKTELSQRYHNPSEPANDLLVAMNICQEDTGHVLVDGLHTDVTKTIDVKSMHSVVTEGEGTSVKQSCRL
jgi:hypothetical protein